MSQIKYPKSDDPGPYQDTGPYEVPEPYKEESGHHMFKTATRKKINLPFDPRIS